MSIPDSTLSIILTALPPTLVALAGLVVSIINSIKSNQIHVLVNSNYNKAQEALKDALAKVESLQKEAYDTKSAPSVGGEDHTSPQRNGGTGAPDENHPGSPNS